MTKKKKSAARTATGQVYYTRYSIPQSKYHFLEKGACSPAGEYYWKEIFCHDPHRHRAPPGRTTPAKAAAAAEAAGGVEQKRGGGWGGCDHHRHHVSQEQVCKANHKAMQFQSEKL